MYKPLKLLFIIFILTTLNGCSNGLYIENDIPMSKIILEPNPDKDTFYSDTYESLTERIYSKDIKILHLKLGENDIPLDDKNKEYALYFILPAPDNKKIENWKYLINPKNNNEFTINKVNILKE